MVLLSRGQILARVPFAARGSQIGGSSARTFQLQQSFQAKRLHIAPYLLPPVFFTGLLVALWCWKCTMLVLLQNAIIYNPYLPPNARKMKISDYARYYRGIQWREERIKSLDGTEISLCVSHVGSGDVYTQKKAKCTSGDAANASKTAVYILYFQGNASSLPPRLPDISSVLDRLHQEDDAFHYTTVGVSYRGYWTSHDRPSEKGINKDATAALHWLSDQHRRNSEQGEQRNPIVVLWGQSIGCGFATNLAASEFSSARNLPIDALVLETPFTNTRDMLTSLYPQKWLPYKYLWPFLRSHLDSRQNLESIGKRNDGTQQFEVYIIEAGKDELVPPDHGTRLQRQCEDAGLPVHRQTVRSALHNEVMARPEGRQAVARSILSAVRKAATKAQ